MKINTNRLTIKYTGPFRKDIKNLHTQKGGENSLAALGEVINIITQQQELPRRHRFHKLEGEYKGYSSCHVHNDLCLIWKVDKDERSVTFYRVGTHSELY